MLDQCDKKDLYASWKRTIWNILRGVFWEIEFEIIFLGRVKQWESLLHSESYKVSALNSTDALGRALRPKIVTRFVVTFG